MAVSDWKVTPIYTPEADNEHDALLDFLRAMTSDLKEIEAGRRNQIEYTIEESHEDGES